MTPTQRRLAPNRLTTPKIKKYKKILRLLIVLLSLTFLTQVVWHLKDYQPATKLIDNQPMDQAEIIENFAQDWHEDISDIRILSNVIRLKVNNRVEVILSKKKSLAQQLQALQLIVNQSKINGKMPAKVDLRFNNPIATY